MVSKKPCALWVNHPLSYGASTDLQSIWPGGRKMICNLTEDERIPSVVRRHTERLLTEQLKRRLFRFGLQRLTRGDSDGVYKVAKILRDELHTRSRFAMLRMMEKSFRRFPLVSYMFTFLKAIYKHFRKNTMCDQTVGPSDSTYLSYLQPSRYAESGAHVDYGVPS